MFKIIKNFNWIILSSFLCIFMGIVTFLTFINEGFVPLTDQNLQVLLITDIILLFFTITHPTEGLFPVKPLLALAKFKANFMKFLS